MIHPTNIRSLTDFKRRTREFLDRLKTTGLPEVLTVEGRGEVVVQDAAAYQKLLQQAAPGAGTAGQASAATFESLSSKEWKAIRESLLRGEDLLAASGLEEAAELFKSGVLVTQERLRRERPEASEEEIDRLLARWVREREGADHGDGPGRPVSAERLARLRGE